MNEEELKEEEMWTCPICKEENFFDYPCKNGCEKKINKKRLEEYQVGFQKGKLEERERVSFEVKRLIVDIKKHWDKVVNPKENVLRGLEQLQKEIGGGVSKE